VSEPLVVDPDHAAPEANQAREVADAEGSNEYAVDVPVATDHPDAGDPIKSSAAQGIPDPAIRPDGQGDAAVPDTSSTSADPRVDDALSRLSEIDNLPLTEQVEVYSDIHRRLAGVLADPDSQA
jgi:hypothetical protein